MFCGIHVLKVYSRNTLIFLEEDFILNLGLTQINYLKVLPISFIVQWTAIVFAKTTLDCFS